MSFIDLERGLSTPPLSPNNDDHPFGKSASHGDSVDKTQRAPLSPATPMNLPMGVQVTRGNSRDSIGLGQHFNLQDQLKLQVHRPSLAQLPHPPPVSPKRQPYLAQHSRILQDNTRIDTPRPTLTASSPEANPFVQAAAASSGGTGPSVAVSVRSPVNRILGQQRPGDSDRRQVLSPPTSPLQFSPRPSPLQSSHRGFGDNRGPSDRSHVASPFSDAGARDPNGENQGMEQTSSNLVGETSTREDEGSLVLTSPTSASSVQEQEHDYDLMVRHLSQQIFNISSNIAVLERLVPCLGQRHKDTAEMRSSLRAVLDSTQDLVKSAHGHVKALAKYHQPAAVALHRPSSPGSIAALPTAEVNSWQRRVQAGRRQTHQRLTKDLTQVSKALQELQRQAVEAERHQVATLRRLSSSASLRKHRSDLMDLSQQDIEAGALSIQPHRAGAGSSSSSMAASAALIVGHDRELSVQEEALLRELLAMDGELSLQESILQERETEILKMEEGMGQVMEVMRELGTLVHEQRGGIDFLQDNILQTRGRIQVGQQEILKASEYQRRSREKLCYLILIISLVGAAVMLAFVST